MKKKASKNKILYQFSIIISAGYYGGKLGKFQIPLRELGLKESYFA